MPTLNLNGIDLHTQVLGEEGPLIFLCHGLVSGSIATWYFQFAPILAKKYRVVMFDMRGHGKSAKPATGYDLHTMSQDLSALIQHYQQAFDLVGQPYSIAGHSYGALVTLHLALHCNELEIQPPESIVVVDAPLPASRFIYPGMKEMQSRADIEQLAEQVSMQLGALGPRRKKNLIDHLEYLYLSTSLKADIAASEDESDSALASLKMPVKLIYGRDSDCHYIGERLAGLIPNSELVTLPCGHYITIEKAEELAEELATYYGV